MAELTSLIYNALEYSQSEIYTKSEIDEMLSNQYSEFKIDISSLENYLSNYIRENYVSKQELNDILYSRSLVGRIKNLLHKAHTSITNFLHRKERKE